MPVSTARPTPNEGEGEAGERRDVLEQDHRELRRLGPPHELDPALLAAHVVGLLDRGAQGERLEHDRDDEHADRDQRVLQRVRVLELVDTLIDREHATDREQDDRDDEGVHVTGAAVAEWMRFVGLALERRPPMSSSTWLPAAASEWTLSASIALEPESRKAMNFAIAMPVLASSAATIARTPALSRHACNPRMLV